MNSDSSTFNNDNPSQEKDKPGICFEEEIT